MSRIVHKEGWSLHPGPPVSEARLQKSPKKQRRVRNTSKGTKLSEEGRGGAKSGQTAALGLLLVKIEVNLRMSWVEW